MLLNCSHKYCGTSCHRSDYATYPETPPCRRARYTKQVVVYVSCTMKTALNTVANSFHSCQPEYFRLSPLLKQVRKVVDGFGKKVGLVFV